MRIIGMLEETFFPVRRRTMPQIWLRGVDDESFERKPCHDARLAARMIRRVFARSRFLIMRDCWVRKRKYERKARFRFAIARLTCCDHHGTV